MDRQIHKELDQVQSTLKLRKKQQILFDFKNKEDLINFQKEIVDKANVEWLQIKANYPFLKHNMITKLIETINDVIIRTHVLL